jgi:carbonic anhydrase/acetyltransferase-like protein (isoleucine patch superfamily)
MVGMNAVLMDDVIVGEGSIIGAMAFVKANMEIPSRSLVVGNPARIVKEVSDEMLEWKYKGTLLYQSLPKDCFETLKETEALTEIPEDLPSQESLLKTWEDIKKG